MKTKKYRWIVSLVEGAVMVALAIVLDLIPFPEWPQGGSITVSMVPIVYYSYRHGWKWGLLAGTVNAAVQIITGWSAPPAGTFVSFVLCALLDYLIAFAVIGIADVFARPFKKHRIAGYAVGAFVVSMIRYLSSFLSGWILWDAYAPEGMPAWLYSLTYNGSYMIPNAILTAVLVTLICLAVDPATLRPMKKQK